MSSTAVAVDVNRCRAFNFNLENDEQNTSWNQLFKPNSRPEDKDPYRLLAF